MTFAQVTQRLSQIAINNSPQILTAIGVVGTVTTAYLAGWASFQAGDLIRLKEADDEERGLIVPDPRELMKQRIELVWRLYIPPVVVGVATVACIVGADRVSAGRAAGLATAYTLLEKNYSDHKAKVVEKFGDRKAEQVQDEIYQDRVNATYLEGMEIRGLDQDEICYESFGGQYFKSTVEKLQAARNSLNKAIIDNDCATLADFYRLLEVEAPAFSETIGWNSDRLMELRIGATVLHEVKSCLTIGFRPEPLPDYGRFRR